jgi:hypothetical protein
MTTFRVMMIITFVSLIKIDTRTAAQKGRQHSQQQNAITGRLQSKFNNLNDAM